MPEIKRGILLMNLGSPASTSVRDVKKYLNEFLMDERVIDIPYFARLLLIKGIIVPFRAPKSAEAYKTIWTKKGSPLVDTTAQLKLALQLEVNIPVEIAMRYGNPSVKQGFDNLLKEDPGIQHVTAIPLYPHYAMSSYESAVEHAKAIHKKNKYPFSLEFIAPYYNNIDYINALGESMRRYLDVKYDHILFSYHGIPQRHIRKSDITGCHCLKAENCCEIASPAHAFCYRHQCISTTKLVTVKMNIPLNKFSISFQSRLGKGWLEPFTDMRLEEMPKEGIKNLLIICPAFVSDCLETLEEIAIRGKETFMNAGGESYTMIPCLNVDVLWVKALVEMIGR